MAENGRTRDTGLERAIEESLDVKGVEAHLDGETILLRRPGRDSARLSHALQEGLVSLDDLYAEMDAMQGKL